MFAIILPQSACYGFSKCTSASSSAPLRGRILDQMTLDQTQPSYLSVQSWSFHPFSPAHSLKNSLIGSDSSSSLIYFISHSTHRSRGRAMLLLYF